VEKNLDFDELLRLIDERSTAFRAVLAGAPDLGAQVPTCPEWTLADLAQHIGEGRLAWAATVAAGPGATGRSAPDGPPMPAEREALDAWLAEATDKLVGALRAAGPDRGCWTWWGPSQSPSTCGAVARHQLQQMAVHTYDAQLTVGAAEPMPAEVALDGVEEFLVTCCATTSAWPHGPAVVHYHATEGRSWRVRLDAGGARIDRLTDAGEHADVSAAGSAHDLVLFFYGRVPYDTLKIDGDRSIFDQLFAWDPSA
jgi:uncharacterized protein (TIGR03083 family)